MSKISRIDSKNARYYDVSDAIAYLRKLVASSGGRPVTYADVRKWAFEFMFEVPPLDTVKRLQEAFEEMYPTEVGFVELVAT